MLNLSREQHQGVGICNLKKAFEDTYSLLIQKFRDYGVEFKNDIPDELFAKIDHNKCEQVVLNLLVNSLQAIRMAYKLGRIAGHSIDISTVLKGEDIFVTVADTGCGISAQNRDSIFRPFFTTKEVGEGTGLGLAISFQIIQEAKGSFSLVESIEGKGTKFLIKLKKK